MSFGGPPLHHHDFDELFYVLEGELTFQVRDTVITRRAGEPAFAPRGVHHTWANHSDAPARTLIVCTPAGFEAYFGQMAAQRAEVAPRSRGGAADPAAPRHTRRALSVNGGAPLRPGRVRATRRL